MEVSKYRIQQTVDLFFAVVGDGFIAHNLSSELGAFPYLETLEACGSGIINVGVFKALKKQ